VQSQLQLSKESQTHIAILSYKMDEVFNCTIQCFNESIYILKQPKSKLHKINALNKLSNAVELSKCF
jgi:hypothetical protein